MIFNDSARTHVLGSSEFIDDRPAVQGELQVGVFFSPHAHTRWTVQDLEAAREVVGVVGIYGHEDLVQNQWGTIVQDQPYLSSRVCHFHGEPILVIAAETRAAVEEAKKRIQMDFEPLKPILSIDEAIAAKNFMGPHRTIESGDLERGFRESDQIWEDAIAIEGQDHFYLESQACIAYPQENGRMEIHASSQHPTEVQHLVAHALGLRYHDVVCIVKRMGGGFGGKESQAAPFAVLAALVAQKTGRASRLILTKDDDMVITGGRNPFKSFFKVGFRKDGTLQALDLKLFSDGGAFADLSTSIMERAMLHSDNAYRIPHIRISGQVCRTHHSPTTAFRGFGGPKGVVTIESILEEIARRVGRDAWEVRKKNVYRQGDCTPYGQKIEEPVLGQLMDQLAEESDYVRRREEILQESSPDFLRGISMTAVKFGIAFTTRHLNQASALVQVHLDGTVQVSTGATEMGQGTFSKIAQVVSQEFGISFEDVRVMPTSTEKNHNTSPSAASSCADLNGAAAVLACQKIKGRLAELAECLWDRPDSARGRRVAGAGTAEEIRLQKKPLSSKIQFQGGKVVHEQGRSFGFSELLDEAYLNRIPLSADGFYRYPEIHFNKETGKGSPFHYFTNGMACSEVRIDRWTGELKVQRVDILMDLGRPLNEGIDLGQVRGGFIQGMGWVTTEKLTYDPEGRQKSISPSTYKIPSVQDIPRDFRVRLIDGVQPNNLARSKTAGEPPLLLAASVWTAAKHALARVQPERAKGLPLPATQEEILRVLSGFQ